MCLQGQSQNAQNKAELHLNCLWYGEKCNTNAQFAKSVIPGIGAKKVKRNEIFSFNVVAHPHLVRAEILHVNWTLIAVNRLGVDVMSLKINGIVSRHRPRVVTDPL